MRLVKRALLGVSLKKVAAVLTSTVAAALVAAPMASADVYGGSSNHSFAWFQFYNDYSPAQGSSDERVLVGDPKSDGLGAFVITNWGNYTRYCWDPSGADGLSHACYYNMAEGQGVMMYVCAGRRQDTSSYTSAPIWDTVIDCTEYWGTS